MAKKMARKKFKKLSFGADSPLPEELLQRLEQIDMNKLREVLENGPSRGMTDEEHAMVLATTMTLAEAHLFFNEPGDDVIRITLPEEAPLLDFRRGRSA